MSNFPSLAEQHHNGGPDDERNTRYYLHDVARGFFSRVASVMALGLAGFVPVPLLAQPAAPFQRPKSGVLTYDDMALALDRLLANGTVFGVCNIALRGQSISSPALPG
jgi:hypothetical protein